MLPRCDLPAWDLPSYMTFLRQGKLTTQGQGEGDRECELLGLFGKVDS